MILKKHPQIKRILAILGVITVVMSSLMLPINAAATEQAEAETFWDKYPFFNILPLTWENIEGEHNGTTITVDEDGSIHITGKINAPGENPLKPGEMLINYYDIVLYEGKGIELPQTVTIAANDTSKKSYLYLFLEGSNRINVQEGETVTFNTNGKKLTKLILRLRYNPENPNPNDCIVHPMLNAGSIAYPYQPYAVKDQLVGEGYDKGYQDGYTTGTNDGYQNGYTTGTNDGYQDGWNDGNNEGYADGYYTGSNDGYENGYTDGWNDGQSLDYKQGYDAGHQTGKLEGQKEGYDQAVDELEKKVADIFEKATFKYGFDIGDGPYHTFEFTPNKAYNTIDFKNITDEVADFIYKNNLWENGFDHLDIILTWNENDTFDYNTFPLSVIGTSLVSAGTITTVDNKSYMILANGEGEIRTFTPQEADGKPIKVKSIKIHVGRPEDLLNEFSLHCNNESYVDGYNNGYKIGYQEKVEYNDFLKEKESYDNGYKKGRTEGIEYGLSLNKDGNWKSMLSAVVEVPSTVFQNLFNFSIFDLDMRVAFGTLMTLCLIAIILKYTLFR